jgi:hypothetical protein
VPSPNDRASIHARVRSAITQSIADEPNARVIDARLVRLGEQCGSCGLSVLAAMALNAMREVVNAVPGAQMAGVAGEVQRSIGRFGEPYRSIVHGITSTMRLQAGGSPQHAKKELTEVWDTWGADAVAVGVIIVVTLYSRVANARGGIGLADAWRAAAEVDDRKMTEYLAEPVVVAEQRLWDAGFSEDESEALLTRLQTMAIGVEEFGGSGTSFADFATTPARKEAVLGLMRAFRDHVRRGRRGSTSGPPETIA